MRIKVTYATSYVYQSDARALLQVLRLTPRSHDGQHVAGWRVETDADVRLRAGEDAFGNIVHTLSTDRPVGGLTITVRGEVRTVDTGGVVGWPAERLPAMVFRRDSLLTRADPAIRDLAARAGAKAGGQPLARMHSLLSTLCDEMDYERAATTVATPAAAAFAAGKGVCQDLAHVFLAAAREMGHPARYVSGHLAHKGGDPAQDGGHAWAEVLVPDLGWVGFDPANGLCPTDAYVRVAVGLDYHDAAPIKGARTGGGEETMTVRLQVVEAQQQ